MRLRRTSGTSLIEILVVIVVFLVGILALVQVFPPGLATLRKTASAVVAIALGEHEVERLAGDEYGLADYVGTVQHISTPSGLQVVLRPDLATRELMPPKDPAGPGRVTINGDLLMNSGTVNLGDWMRLAASNRISRVVGESHKIGAPKAVGNYYGSMVNLTFAPVYYLPIASGVGEPGVVQVYGNDMARRFGDRKSASPIPASFAAARDWEFFYVSRDKTDPLGPFPNEDQIWLGPSTDRQVRVSLSFSYAGPGGTEQYEAVYVANLIGGAVPTYATIVDNYWVVSLPRLIGQPDVHGRTVYNSANVLGVARDSVRTQRLFQEIPVLSAWSATNPYQYKALNQSLGTLLINPAAFDFNVRTEHGQDVPLVATADYTVFDWRILRDEFRVPARPGDVKLVMSSIKPLGASLPDARRYPGLGFDVPALDNSGNLAIRGDDFLVIDLDTGGIILGNMADATNLTGGYYVNKTHGSIQFRDTDTTSPLAVEVPVAYATGDPLNPWTVVTEDVAGHAVRSLYQAQGEWSVQMYRSAARYRVTDILAANGLQVSEVYAGGTRFSPGPVGSDRRIYFPLSDLGQRVVVGEIWYRDSGGNLRVLKDQNLLIDGVENLLGVDHAYADIAAHTGGGTLDTTFAMGYILRRVRGASITIRVLNNPAYFTLDSDEVENYNRIETWSRNWRRHETESYTLGGGS